MCKHLRWMDIYTHRTTSSPAWGDFTGEGKPEVCYLMPHGQRHTAAQTLHCEASTTPTSPQLKLAILDTCSSNLMAFFCSNLSSGTNAAVIFTRTSGTFLGGFNPCTPATLLPRGSRDPHRFCLLHLWPCCQSSQFDPKLRARKQLYCLTAAVSSWWVCCDEIRTISWHFEAFPSEPLWPLDPSNSGFLIF